MRIETKLNIAVAAAVALLAAAFKLSAAPTANEDYVDAQDAQTYTNALRDAKAYTDAATGAVRMLPKYLRELRFADSYPDAAAWYYSRYARAGGACSSVRDGNTLSRNYDWDFDAAPSWVIEMEAGPDRFGSVGVASVGTNLAAGVAIDGSPFYKALPGMTLDGVNENGVAVNINVVSSFGHTNGWHGSALHCLGAVRWVLDHATNAQHAAEYLAANVYVPQAMLEAGYSYHYMIADAAETWIAEDGQARMVGTIANRSVMTNFRNFDPQADPYGTGRERYTLLENGGSITSAWFTLAYVAPGRESEFRAPGVDAAAACARAVASWATKPKEQHRGETFEDGAHWWQSVHTSVYNISNRVLRVAVQETDDWYTFAVPSAGGVDEAKVRGIVRPMIDGATSNKADRAELADYLPLSGGTVTGGVAVAQMLTAGMVRTPFMSVEGGDFVVKPQQSDDNSLGLHIFAGNGTTDYGFLVARQVGTELLFDQFVLPVGSGGGTFAMTNDISAASRAFSNAVVSVTLPIGTNELAVLRDIGGLPVGEGAAGLGAIVLALASAVAWLKRNKFDTASVSAANETFRAAVEACFDNAETTRYPREA